jgi:hypothetical protein
LRLLDSPELTAAYGAVSEALASREFLVVVGNCRIEYEGRASSRLEWGERMLVVKEDGAVLVHRPLGYEPVNWQPPRCILKAEVTNDDLLKITATRMQPHETIVSIFDRLLMVASYRLSDLGEFALHVTELQMKEAILAEPSLIETGLKPISQEQSLGDSGFTDVIAEDSKGKFVVVEIKRNAATRDAVLQLQRYVDNLRERVERPIRGIIAAPGIRRSAQPLMASLGFEFKQVLPERCYSVLKDYKSTRLSEFF